MLLGPISVLWLNKCYDNWRQFNVTCAFSGCRHVAKICFVGLFELSKCLTMPKPRPRLLPVIKIEFMMSKKFFYCLRITLSSTQLAPDVWFFFLLIQNLWVKTLKRTFFCSFYFSHYFFNIQIVCQSSTYSIYILYSLSGSQIIRWSNRLFTHTNEFIHNDMYMPHAYINECEQTS